MTHDRLLIAFLAAVSATIAAAVHAFFDFTVLSATLVVGWKLVALTLGYLLVRRGPVR